MRNLEIIDEIKPVEPTPVHTSLILKMILINRIGVNIIIFDFEKVKKQIFENFPFHFVQLIFYYNGKKGINYFFFHHFLLEKDGRNHQFLFVLYQ